MSLIFNYKNICKLTWLKREDIKSINILSENKAEVILDDEKILVTKNQLIPIVKETRRESAKDLSIVDKTHHGIYYVPSSKHNTLYRVREDEGRLTCECYDYQNLNEQVTDRQMGCKHVYAVLSELGYSSLEKYIEDSRSIAY